MCNYRRKPAKTETEERQRGNRRKKGQREQMEREVTQPGRERGRHNVYRRHKRGWKMSKRQSWGMGVMRNRELGGIRERNKTVMERGSAIAHAV